MLGLLGVAGAGLAIAPALRVLTWPLLALNIWVLSRGWYLQLGHGNAMLWQRRSMMVLVASSVLSVTLWTLRFLGMLGARPF